MDNTEIVSFIWLTNRRHLFFITPISETNLIGLQYVGRNEILLVSYVPFDIQYINMYIKKSPRTQ